jgi:hypothetical protein
MSYPRRSFAMPTAAAFALVFPGAAIHQPTTYAQPDLKKPDRKAPQVAAELVGQREERQASGPLGICVHGDYAYLAAWRRGLRVVEISNPKEPKELAGCRIQGEAKDVVVAGGYAFLAAEEGSLRVLGPGSPGVPEGSRLLSRSRCGSCSERGGEIRLRRRWICEG